LRAIYKDGNGEKYVFDDGKNICEHPVAGHIFRWQLACIDINEERAGQVDHHAQNDPEMVPAINEKRGHILHLLVQVIERKNENADRFHTNRNGVDAVQPHLYVINDEGNKEGATRQNDDPFKSPAVDQHINCCRKQRKLHKGEREVKEYFGGLVCKVNKAQVGQVIIDAVSDYNKNRSLVPISLKVDQEKYDRKEVGIGRQIIEKVFYSFGFVPNIENLSRKY
jgi:hypothetical protein